MITAVSSWIKNNKLITPIHESMLIYNIKMLDNFDNNIILISALLSYGLWYEDSDIFVNISKKGLRSLRKKKEYYFLFDCSLEGWGPNQVPLIKILYNNCKKYNINPKKIIYATSNLEEPHNLKKYNNENNVKDSIKLLAYPHFKSSARNFFFEHVNNPIFNNNENYFKFIKDLSNQNYEKYFLSMSRRNREQRILANYLLHENQLDQYALISQDRFNSSMYINMKEQFDISPDLFLKWHKTLPKIIDTDQFQINQADNINHHIYSKTLFEVVNETEVNNYNKTTMFYSEKTFKAILNLQPFIIFGHKDCNKRLEDLGFELYRDHFDYSFDDEPDTKIRYLKIIDTIKSTVVKLNNMSRSQQLDWKFKSKELLLKNLDVLKKFDYEETLFKELLIKINSEISS